MTCHNCRIDCQRFGKHRNGLHRFRCNQCGKTYTEPHEEQPTAAELYMNEDRGRLALRLLAEGNSVRAVERLTEFHRNTILDLLITAGQRCDALLTAKIQGVPVTDVQCDEIWCFVRKKQAHRYGDEKDFAYIGDAWVFVGIERHTKLVLAYHLGKRTVSAASRFMAKLAVATSDERFQLTTDGLNAYNYAVGNELGDRVDYAQLIKIYAQADPEDQRRYSPAHLAEALPTPVYGDPDEKRICTSHVERQNLTMRTFIRRFTRLTCAFSKKWENLRAALALHFAYYNFCRVHRTLGTTPAVAAGITDRAWTIGELLNAG